MTDTHLVFPTGATMGRCVRIRHSAALPYFIRKKDICKVVRGRYVQVSHYRGYFEDQGQSQVKVIFSRAIQLAENRTALPHWIDFKKLQVIWIERRCRIDFNVELVEIELIWRGHNKATLPDNLRFHWGRLLNSNRDCGTNHRPCPAHDPDPDHELLVSVNQFKWNQNQFNRFIPMKFIGKWRKQNGRGDTVDDVTGCHTVAISQEKMKRLIGSAVCKLEAYSLVDWPSADSQNFTIMQISFVCKWASPIVLNWIPVLMRYWGGFSKILTASNSQLNLQQSSFCEISKYHLMKASVAVESISEAATCRRSKAIQF